MTRIIGWERRYGRKLLVTDLAIATLSIALAQYIRFGIAVQDLQIPLEGRSQFQITYTALSAMIALAWIFALSLSGTRDPQAIGTGPTEYVRVFNATLFTFGLFAILAFAFKAQIGRGYLMIALPIGLFLLLFSRWLWRKRLHSQRGRGKNSYRTLIVGDWAKNNHVAKQIMTSPTNGFWIVGMVTENQGAASPLNDIEVINDYTGVERAVDQLKVDTVILTSADMISPERIREIGWLLEARRIDLIVAAALTDVAGPRIHTRPVSGLPLIHVEFPTFSGPKHLLKRVFDLFGSAVILLLISPVLLAVALAVKFTSQGPVLYS